MKFSDYNFIEENSLVDKRKLFDAVVFYVPERISIWHKIIKFLTGE